MATGSRTERNATPMNVTVVICTYNRCECLARALESIAAQVLPDSVRWEVLVIDNNSTDHTRDVVGEFSKRFPGRFRCVVEPQQGLSFARNTGVRESRGTMLAFTDDDVIVEPTWLQNLTAPMETAKCGGVGGRTLIAGAFSPPKWMKLDGEDNLGAPLAALFDYGLRPCSLHWPPYGANMAFRKEMFEKYGLFRVDLGISPGNRIPNEDTEFGRRLMAAGEQLVYAPSAVVYHPVFENRLRKSYFLGWFFDYGRATVREWKCGPNILGIPRRYFSIANMIGFRLPQRTFRWIWTFNPQQRFFNKCRAWSMAGQIVETYRLARDSKGQKGDPSERAKIGYGAHT